MKGKHLTGRALIVQIDKEQMRIALVQMGHNPKLQYSSVAETPEGAVEDGVINNPAALRDALSNAIGVPAYHNVRKVIFSLCSTQVLSEVVTVPNMPERRLEKLLQANIDVYFPFDIHDYHLVWTPTGVSAANPNEQVVQLWAVPNALVARYYALGNACGLSVEGIDYCGNSMVSAVGASFAGQAKKSALSLDMNISFGKKGDKADQPKKEKKAKQQKEKKSGGLFGKKNAAAVVEEKPAETEDVLAESLSDALPDTLHDTFDEVFAENYAEKQLAKKPADTVMYLLADREHLLMTFVRGGHVELQRLTQRGGSSYQDMDEAQMFMEYFTGRNDEDYNVAKCVVCGEQAADFAYRESLEEYLGIPVEAWESAEDPTFFLCLGAARMTLDFGVAEMNHPAGLGSQLSQAWQYGLVLVGGAALAAVLILYFGSQVVWNTTLTGLESNMRVLQIQAAQNSGNAANYNKYAAVYDSYSNDWDTIFSNLRTYNDNLVLMLTELEKVLPKATSVVGMNVDDAGLSLKFACTDKEEAAFLLIKLRDLQYATLDTISNVTGGGGGAAGHRPEDEAPPTEGSFDVGSLSTAGFDIEDLASEQDVMEMMSELTPEEIAAIEEWYGTPPEPKYTYKELSNKSGFNYKNRKAAMENMLTNDQIAMYGFYRLFEEDMNKDEDDQILFPEIKDDLWGSPLLGTMLNGGDVSEEQMMDELITIVTKDDGNLKATEDLILTDEQMTERYCYYLALEMDLKQVENPDVGKIDYEKLLADVMSGKRPGNDPDLHSAMDKLEAVIGEKLEGQIPGGTTGGDTVTPGGTITEEQAGALEDYLTDNWADMTPDEQQIITDAYLSGDYSGLAQLPPERLEDIMGILGQDGMSEPEDTRIFFSVTLGYKPALIEAELQRKGLYYDEKLTKLEVAE